MEIEWRPAALQDLSDILDYIFEVGGKRPAVKLADKIDTAVARLASLPESGTMEPYLNDDAPDYRFLLVDKTYKIIYKVDNYKNIVHIFIVWDCRQNPNTLKQKITDRE